jgi:hypothetical protein
LRLSREEYESTIENLKGDIEGLKVSVKVKQELKICWFFSLKQVRIQHSEDEIVELGVYKTAFEEIHSGKLEKFKRLWRSNFLIKLIF